MEITRGFKFREMLKVTFEKVTHDSDIKIHRKAYCNSKAKTITNVNEIGPELSTSRQEIIRMIEIGYQRVRDGLLLE